MLSSCEKEESIIHDLNISPDEISKTIASHILDFIHFEHRQGRLPKGMCYQSGVGNVANAVLAAMALASFSASPEILEQRIFETSS